ncbi:hypothetical protein JYU34_022548 [Plutella xylostella]|uniref:Transposase n=1 Tax=Plutella xylostella TaxID=51655 RepID=A0ABQ7PQ11_PLUXY|nr:hypothetical protein JYU34_022548 [Plutella xylostella]
MIIESQWMGKMHNIISCASETHRTNNSLEGWHRRLNSRIKGRLTFINFLYKLKKEAYWQSLKLRQSLFEGNSRRKKDLLFNSKYEKELEKLNKKEITSPYFIKKLCKIRRQLFQIYHE